MSISAINGFEFAVSQISDTKDIDSASFEKILKEQTKKQSVQEMFGNLFSTYKVSCKIGNCDVSSADWARNDFPSWKFFEDSTKADELNHWCASGSDVSSMNKDIRNSWNRTDERKIVILIPDELAAKMESDSDYAKQVLSKVYLWQTNHASLEKALSEGYGYDGELSTFQDSYLLKLDSDGNVTDYVVTGPGYDSSLKKSENNSSEKYSPQKIKEMLETDQISVHNKAIAAENVSGNMLYDYTFSMGLLAAAESRKKMRVNERI